jgi:tripartite-type tricarboxylate transporter receptor subunit TctC
MRIDRRTLLGTAVAGICAGVVPRAFAQNDWPSRPVKIVSPYGAGGPNDISARLLGKDLEQRLSQAFVVENKAGAGTLVANEFVANAAPDGYTLLYAAAPYATLEALNRKLSYDPRKDLQPVAMTATVPLFLVVNTKSPANSAQELIAHGKSRPDGLTFGSPGNGSLPHLAAELLLRAASVKGIVIQYRGDVAANTDLLAGRIDATLTAITTALPHIQSGDFKVLGVAANSRSEIYPQAQPLPEQGFTDVVASGWYGFMAPAGVPKTIVDRLDTQINLALRDPKMKQELLKLGMEADGRSAGEFGKFIESEMVKWGGVIEKAGMRGS